MIEDSKSLKEIQEDWKGLKSLQKKIGTGQVMVGGMGSYPTIQTFRIAHNLILVFAFAILRDVLTKLRDDKYFKSKESGLYPLMWNSRKDIAWSDFNTVDKGCDIRDKIAHENEIIDTEECFSKNGVNSLFYFSYLCLNYVQINGS